eukprot:gene9645-12985_t
MKGQGGGGTARGGGKSRSGGGVVKSTKSEARQTKAIEDNIVRLRKAIFDDNGKDKDVTKGIAASFMKYDRNGLDLSIEFTTKLNQMSKSDVNHGQSEVDWAFELVQDTMQEKYDASGYGWDNEDKLRELTEPGARFLLVREWPVDNQDVGDLVGFVHFRFTVQGEVIDKMAGEPCLFVFDIHLEEHCQRKGLGKHLLTILELIARREKLSFLSIPIQLNDESSLKWISGGNIRGFVKDETLNEIGFDSEMETLPSPIVKPVKPSVVTSTTVTSPTPVINDEKKSSSYLPNEEEKVIPIILTRPKHSSSEALTDIEHANSNDSRDEDWVVV